MGGGTVRTMARAGSAVERLPDQVEAALEAAVREPGDAAEEAGSGLRALVRLAAGRVPSPRCDSPSDSPTACVPS